MKAAAAAAAGPGPAAAAAPVAVASGVAAVSVAVSSSLNAFRAHKRYSRGLTIAEFKCKLELVVGSPASCMDLELYSPDDQLLGRLDCDEALLGSYPVDDGCRIHVLDRSGARLGEFEDVSQVPKYEMPESEYDKRPESLRSFLKRRQLGRYGEAAAAADGDGDGDEERRRAQERAQAAAVPLGARCQVRVPGQPAKRGTVMYVGLTDFKPGYWIGVRYDEPLGKHDGSVAGRRYFECRPRYGAFVKPPSVTVGDFPEEDDGLEEEEM
ncbi:tubulin-folding cofactor B [Dromaius novaehollandiae]|uniref:tubulin-folding cofactor B n=1 Tax=Dromaius novaehollandiae TaxID=8790 RepID=UPI00311D5374